MTLQRHELIRELKDGRCPPDAEIKVRVVDRSREDGPHGSYYAEEFPLALGFTGWEDGHWSILAYGRISDTDKLLLKLRELGHFFRLHFDPSDRLEAWQVSVQDGGGLAQRFAGATFTDALRKAVAYFDKPPTSGDYGHDAPGAT